MSPERVEDDLNKFLPSHRVLQVERHFVGDSGGYWALLVEYMDGDPAAEVPPAQRRGGERVERLKSGRVKVILSDARPLEKAALLPICFDDAPLFPEDAIVLANGDTFILGQTKLTYRK